MNRHQCVVLGIAAINLLLVLLFPPFESVFALTNAALPTFEGFYFIFSQKPFHIIVTALLYIEAIFILINGALLWLVFKERQRPPTPAEAQALAARLRGKH